VGAKLVKAEVGPAASVPVLTVDPAGAWRVLDGEAAAAVDVCQPAEGGGWLARLRVRGEDDVARGVLRILVTPIGGAEVAETVHYDPDTGAVLPTQAPPG
jgi:hypothetical protein